MESSTKKNIIIGVVLVAFGYGAGYFTKPSKVEVVAQSKEKSTEVVKTQKDKVENKNKVVVIKETTNKDGSKTKETVITDRGTVDTSTKTDSKKEVEKESSTKTITTNDIGLTIQALAGISTKNFKEIDTYGILIKKRIISNFSGSIIGTTDKKFDEKKILLGVGVDF